MKHVKWILLLLVCAGILFAQGGSISVPYMIGTYDSSGNTARVRIDASTSSLQVIDYEHHEIHGGSMFEYTDVNDLAGSAVWGIQITTPDTTEYTHMVIEFETESETNWWFYENVTISQAGDAVTELNMNRNSAHAATTAVAEILNASLALANTDTVVSGATMLLAGISGAGKQRGGGSLQRDEFVLKRNEDYLIRFEAASAGYVNLHLTWYEHTDQN